MQRIWDDDSLEIFFRDNKEKKYEKLDALYYPN